MPRRRSGGGGWGPSPWWNPPRAGERGCPRFPRQPAGRARLVVATSMIPPARPSTRPRPPRFRFPLARGWWPLAWHGASASFFFSPSPPAAPAPAPVRLGHGNCAAEHGSGLVADMLGKTLTGCYCLILERLCCCCTIKTHSFSSKTDSGSRLPDSLSG